MSLSSAREEGDMLDVVSPLLQLRFRKTLGGLGSRLVDSLDLDECILTNIKQVAEMVFSLSANA